MSCQETRKGGEVAYLGSTILSGTLRTGELAFAIDLATIGIIIATAFRAGVHHRPTGDGGVDVVVAWTGGGSLQVLVRRVLGGGRVLGTRSLWVWREVVLGG